MQDAAVGDPAAPAVEGRHVVDREIGPDVFLERVHQLRGLDYRVDAECLLLDLGDDHLLAPGTTEVGRLLRLFGVPRTRDLERLLAGNRVVAGFVVDARAGGTAVARTHAVVHVAVLVVRVMAVVEREVHVHGDAAERVNHVPKSLEVDAHIAVECEAGEVAHGVLGEMPTAVATRVPGQATAPPTLVHAHLERRVDLLVVSPVHVAVLDANPKVARDGDQSHPIRGRVEPRHHDRVGQVGSVVLVAAIAEEEDVDRLPVLDLVGDRAGPGVRVGRHGLADLGDRSSARDGAEEVQDPRREECGPADHDDQQGAHDHRRGGGSQSMVETIAGPPGSQPGHAPHIVSMGNGT